MPLGLMSGIITSPEFNAAIPETKNNSTIQGFVTAIYEIGCLVGAVFILLMGDKLGRRRSIMSGAVVMIIGTIIQVCTYHTSGSGALVSKACLIVMGGELTGRAQAQFVIGRIITGVGNGMNTSSIPTYQAECSKTKNRGLLICIEGGTIAFGTCTPTLLFLNIAQTHIRIFLG